MIGARLLVSLEHDGRLRAQNGRLERCKQARDSGRDASQTGQAHLTNPFSLYGITAVDMSTWGPVETIARPEAAPTAATPLAKEVWCQVELPANRTNAASPEATTKDPKAVAAAPTGPAFSSNTGDCHDPPTGRYMVNSPLGNWYCW